MNKVALSPLVATLLLIVFSVVLGVITLKYGAHFVEGQAVEYVDNGQVCPAGCITTNLETNTRSNFQSEVNTNRAT